MFRPKVEGGWAVASSLWASSPVRKMEILALSLSSRHLCPSCDLAFPYTLLMKWLELKQMEHTRTFQSGFSHSLWLLSALCISCIRKPSGSFSTASWQSMDCPSAVSLGEYCLYHSAALWGEHKLFELRLLMKLVTQKMHGLDVWCTALLYGNKWSKLLIFW